MLEGIFRRRRLPHWDVDDGTYFVTACLKGSLPTRGLAELESYRQHLESLAKPEDLSEADWEINKQKLVFARFDALIDNEPAVRHLERPELAMVVRKCLYHFAGERYDLLSYVVMPSHFHWVFHPRTEWVQRQTPDDKRTPRERIMQSIKGYSANQCNGLLGFHGEFWQDESYDHVVRHDEEMWRIIEYIEQNPVKAKLVINPEDWRWSSAYDRRKYNLRPGEPLIVKA